MRDKVLRYIRERELIRAGDRVAVAVSGGADSVALLRTLLELRTELGIVLAVTHFNHLLREQSAADEAFVVELAKTHGVDFFGHRQDVRDHASARKLSIEAAGRELRYRSFTELAYAERFDCIATAHTLDDQAETVLLKFLRGTGTRGLAGIYPRFDMPSRPSPEIQSRPRRRESVRIVRPLLCITRAQVEGYLTSIGQSWREDETNLDRRFLRNRVRHELLPLLQREYNPNLPRLLADLAELSRAEEEYWSALVDRYLTMHTSPGQMNVKRFAELPLAMQRRVVRGFAGLHHLTLDFEHAEGLRYCALGDPKRIELPRGRIAVNDGCLRICDLKPRDARGYRYVLPVSGEVRVAELETTLRALIVSPEFAREFAPGVLLKRDLVGTQLTIRNWNPGDRYHPSHRGSEEKLKRLFAENRIPLEQRASWPVALHNGDIVWVPGFPVAKAYQWDGQGDAVSIEVIALAT